jgi:two-component system LytT family response regulator
MNILILEDELPASSRLQKLVRQIEPDSKISALDSIAAAEEWFAANPMPALVLMDIHLADGSAFELLKRVSITAPIIFTTAYDQYAIEAFKSNSIDYLLKPIRIEELKGAWQKMEHLKKIFSPAEEEALKSAEHNRTTIKKRFVIRIGEHLKTLATDDIAYCYSENKMTYARSHDGRNFPMDHNLDALETMLDPQNFFRINRQYIVSLKAIEEMRAYSKSRVIIRLRPPVKETPVVSAERSADFKMWLGGEL